MRHLVLLSCAVVAVAACRPAAQSPAPAETATASSAAASAPAGQPAAAATAAAPLRLTCDAGFRPDMTEDQMRERFGAANVTQANVDMAEGQTEPGTILFANDPTRRAEVHWVDPQARMRIAQIRIGQGATAWTGPGGLKVGAPLAEVERVNGRPFTLSGFEWDYGGIPQNMRGGTLAATGPDECTNGLRFTLGANPGANAASGDREFSSDSAEVRAANAVLNELSIGWPFEASAR